MLLAPAALVAAPAAATDVDPASVCFWLVPNQYCVKNTKVTFAGYITGVAPTGTVLATIDIQRWFVSIEQNYAPGVPPPGAAIVTGVLNNSPKPTDLNACVTNNGKYVCTNTVFQKSLCGLSPCFVVHNVAPTNIGEVWISSLEISENGQPLVRTPFVYVVLYAPLAQTLVDIGDPDFEDFTT